jgi:cobalt-zinc-cadmium resistance protein CzcA
LTELTVNEQNGNVDPGLQMINNNLKLQKALTKVEQNQLLPDLNLGIFNGTNPNEGAKNYLGFQIGVGIPLFFGNQRAKIKAGKIGISIAENMQENYSLYITNKKNELEFERIKYGKAIQSYQDINRELSEEILKSAQKSYNYGEIDFYKYIQSVENAISIQLDYLENLSKYNYIVLEINYLTN